MHGQRHTRAAHVHGQCHAPCTLYPVPGSVAPWSVHADAVHPVPCTQAAKLVGIGCAGYWADRWNVLDGTIVLMSIVEMMLDYLLSGSGTNVMVLRMLRMLRVARMLRLMRSWRGLHQILSTVLLALPQMANVIILMCLINTIFALLGMQVSK